jgi:F0F1-type ATP synthase delta subunit
LLNFEKFINNQLLEEERENFISNLFENELDNIYNNNIELILNNDPFILLNVIIERIFII